MVKVEVMGILRENAHIIFMFTAAGNQKPSPAENFMV